MRSRNVRYLPLAFLVLMALACNAIRGPEPTTAPEEGEVSATPPLPTQTEEASATQAAPSETPPPPATEEAGPTEPGDDGCTLDAGWVADVTVPDDAEFDPDEDFVKTWRIRNKGTCEWEAGTEAVFVSGDQLDAPDSVPVGTVAPGSTTDISVNMTAPSEPGTYRGNWQLQAPDDTRFGSVFYVRIVVPGEPTETPTEEATEEPTGEADLIISDLSVDTDDPRQGVPMNIVAILRNRGDATAEDVRWAWRVCVHEGCEFTEAPGNFTLEPGERVTAEMEYTFGGYATYTTEAWVDPDEVVEESDEENNTRRLEISVRANPETSETLHPVPSRSGSLSSAGRDGTIKAGIAPAGNGIRAYVDFDLAELDELNEESQIGSAMLDVSDFSGDCFEFLHPLRIQQVTYGAELDYPDDYEGAGSPTFARASSAVGISSPIDITDFLQDFVESKGAGHVQIRMYYDGDDAGSSFACMTEWTDPTLTVVYRP
ncbi:MAG: NBR1-Ig-like domain-containing protein [Chloroflexota bacterium]|nr:NBR1-Ig-like domain-containing protein [Chloroflexota bacterium]